ncbi:hypothetical protein [Haloarcula sp. CGMCC 1.2071]|uniref:hypothetical protein n=1 Tax=Haloarcula sp. CGMCC 1.2071 TaxID=3111454 RepID=UPI00300E6FBB
MDRRTRLIVYYLVIVVIVLSGFVVLYNYGMATWEGRPQPLYRSVGVIVQTVTTVGYGGDAPWTSPQMNSLVSLMALSGLVLIFAAPRCSWSKYFPNHRRGRSDDWLTAGERRGGTIRRQTATA